MKLTGEFPTDWAKYTHYGMEDTDIERVIAGILNGSPPDWNPGPSPLKRLLAREQESSKKYWLPEYKGVGSLEPIQEEAIMFRKRWNDGTETVILRGGDVFLRLAL